MGVTSKDGSDGSEGSEGKEGSDRLLAPLPPAPYSEINLVSNTCGSDVMKYEQLLKQNPLNALTI